MNNTQQPPPPPPSSQQQQQQQQQLTATVKVARPTMMPSNYSYTSSSGLLNKPAPPPTLPKYTSSFKDNASAAPPPAAAATTTISGGGSYRLSSMDRLAARQRFIDNAINGSTATNKDSTDSTAAAPLAQTRREQFFSSTSVDSNKSLAKTPPEAKDDSVASKESDPTSATNASQPPVLKAKPKELDGYVGFANLPNQVYRKAVKKGFEFTLMVVGESGLGKSTLINSLFLSDIYASPDHPGPTQRLKKTVSVESSRVLLKENGVNLLLTVVDTPGFGDAVDNSECWSPIIQHIEAKYEDYLNQEARVTRQPIPDQRVHCCLYFIQPSGHGLKALDVECMRRLCDRVNLIPVIAKADTLTADECAEFKRRVLEEIGAHGIRIYRFPEALEEEDSTTSKDDSTSSNSLKDRIPFAVVGSNAVIELEGGRKVRGRRYPWGVAEVENLAHCDFIALRNTILRTHLQDLQDVTNNVHYENYRCLKLAGLGADGKPTRPTNKNPLAQMDEEKREHDLKMKNMEAEMEQVFEMKVREKKQKLKDSEAELTRRHEATRKTLEQQAKELEEKRRQFEAEKAAWERDNQVTVEELRRRSLEGKETLDLKQKKKKGIF